MSIISRSLIMLAAAVLLAGIIYALLHLQGGRVQSGETRTLEGVLRAGSPEFDNYRSYVRIPQEQVKAELWDNLRGDRFAVIAGTMTNYGDRKLEAVELKIRLYDLYDRVLIERIAAPFRPGAKTPRGDTIKGPLEFGQPFRFTVRIENIPEYWNPKRVDVELNGLKFANRQS